MKLPGAWRSSDIVAVDVIEARLVLDSRSRVVSWWCPAVALQPWGTWNVRGWKRSLPAPGAPTGDIRF